MQKNLRIQEEKENDMQLRYQNLRSEKERLEKMLAAVRG
jgi:hypothetical protein